MSSTIAPRLVLAGALAFTGCAQKVDHFTVTRVVDRALGVPDLGKVCGLGESLAHPLAALTKETNPANKALVFAEATAGMCHQIQAWEADLDAVRSRHNLLELGPARIAEVKDARIQAERHHALAAQRFLRSFEHLESEYGRVGDACPRVKERDEIVWLVGLVSGTLALLHDKAAGSPLGVPLDTINRVGRAAPCIGDEAWWQVPSAMQAAAWATVPGTGPEGIDPWERLERAADRGASSGVRVSRALYVMIASNAGMSEKVAEGIAAHGRSLREVPPHPEWALLDEYARSVSLHEADLLWAEAVGHRAPSLGQLPRSEEEAPAGPDPFAEDPFAADPYAEPSAPDDAPAAIDESTDPEDTP